MNALIARRLVLLLLATGASQAQVPPLINYQGRVAVATVNFDGAGQFKFALVNADGSTTYWSNDGTSALGNEPAGAVPITITGGVYSVMLGDATLPNMTPVPAMVFANPDVRLRVWFNDGTNGSQLLTPDQRIAAVGYAMMAGNVPDGAITTAKIANGAVGQTELAAGAVGPTQLATNAVGSAHLADGSITTAKIAAGAVKNSQLAPGVVSGDFWVPTASSGLAARHSHTAVWTGSEMIVWGGTGAGGTYFDGGSRYDPALNTWTPTASSGLLGRLWHTAVWTGSEMIVWGGGAAAGAYFNDGARYDPAGDSWTAMAAATGTAPSPRRRHTAVWTGSEMIVWGGYSGTYLNTGARYNPGFNSWLDTSDSGAAGRSEHTAVWTGSEMIVWGGSNGGFLNDGRRYNPEANSWATTNPSGAPGARFSHTAVWAGSEMIVWGGAAPGDDDFSYLNDGGRYNPVANSWVGTATSGAPFGRFQHTAVWTGNEMMVWGGNTSSTPWNTGGRYEPASNTWTASGTSGVPAARAGHTAVWTGIEMTVWGGVAFPSYFNDGARLRLSNIRDASIGTVELANNAVTTAKIAVPLNLSGGSFAGGSILSGTNSNTAGAGVAGTGGTGVAGVSTGGSTGVGVSGDGGSGTGVKGIASGSTGTGVSGINAAGTGVYGESTSGIGVSGVTTLGTGVFGRSNSIIGKAGRFAGSVDITGSLTKGGGSFKIDHPLDPSNKYLSHSFVESPDMMNIYNGNMILDSKGEAVVALPEWFGALNKEFRYQLTCLGGFAPVYIAEEIAGNRFKIAGGKSGLKVSWQVTGVRQDAWANTHRIPTEEDKPGKERGSYLHPQVLGQPAEKSLEWAQHPEIMRARKERETAGK